MGCRNAYAGPKPGLWDCDPSDSGSLFNVKEKPGTLPQLCSLQGADSSNPMCLGRVGLARPVDTPMSLIAPALTAIKSGDTGTFRKRSLAVHKCKARLESRVPSSSLELAVQADARPLPCPLPHLPSALGPGAAVESDRRLCGRGSDCSPRDGALCHQPYVPEPRAEHHSSETQGMKADILGGKFCGSASDECNSLTKW